MLLLEFARNSRVRISYNPAMLSTLIASLALLPAPQAAVQDPVFNGTEPVEWRGTRGWAAEGDAIANSGSNPEHLFSTGTYGDQHVHVEFKIPRGSNSGVYVMGRYEVQILDSSGKKASEMTSSDCGGIYDRWRDNRGYDGHAPLANAFRGPDLWNVYDITFRAPRFDAEGKKIENARFLEVRLNGVVVQRDAPATGPTRAAFFEDEGPLGPLVLQGDHGPVSFRNVWVRPIRTEG
jgi:hypothetical protein